MKHLLAVLLVVLLAGCAGTGETKLLRMNPQPTAATHRMFFPPPSDGQVPRYVYSGELIGEQNFIYPEGHRENGLVTAFRWIVGLFEEDRPTELQRPQSGVVDESGRILVTDVSRGAVFVFDENHGRLDVWEMAEGYRHFIAPSGIALGPEGRVFVADADLKRVFLLDRDGNGVGVIGADQLQRPTGLAWDANAALLYVADTYAHCIKVFDMTGRLVRTIGERGEEPGQFNYPTYLAIGHGKLLVADTMNARVQALDLEGDAPPVVMGKRGVMLGDMVRPKGVAMDSEGNYYVVESYHDHLLVFDGQGRFLLPIGGAGRDVGRFYLPSGVWVDARNRVFVADTFNGRIVIFQFLGGGRESE
ncbi:MAG TPA: 6-bladed beta-propeller [Rhodocyclaceae bacterium]|nr:6-bladed beta-propeller [Rhodocyclaceae bacterium]